MGVHRAKVDLAAIGHRIRKIRGQILQEELCTYLNVTQGDLSKIERGKIAPSLATFRRKNRFQRKPRDGQSRTTEEDGLRGEGSADID